MKQSPQGRDANREKSILLVTTIWVSARELVWRIYVNLCEGVTAQRVKVVDILWPNGNENGEKSGFIFS